MSRSNVSVLILVLAISGVSLAWDNFLFRQYCQRSELSTIFGMCFNVLQVSPSNALEKNGYSAASTGTVFIEAQSSVVPKPNSFTVLSTGKIRIKCKTRTPKASLGSDEIVGIFPVQSGDGYADLTSVVTGAVAEAENVFSRGLTVYYKSDVPLECSWRPHLGLDLPQTVYPAQVLSCVVDQPQTCKWGNKNKFVDLMQLLSDISVRPELSNSGKGLLGSATADCSRIDNNSLSCAWLQFRYLTREEEMGVLQDRLFQGGRLARSSWRCELRIYHTTNLNIYFKPVCWVI